MAKVATRDPLPSNLMHFGGGGSICNAGYSKDEMKVKRKSPSELRNEQLKRKKTVELVDKSPDSARCSVQDSNGGPCGFKNPNLSKYPRYLDTRMNELFPVTKNSNRLRLLSRKENAEVPHASTATFEDDAAKLSHSTTEKCSKSKFRSVTELSYGGQKQSDFFLDMDEAFKGLAAREPPVVSTLPTESLEGNSISMSTKFCSEFLIPGQRIPLDFTLKTTMRLVSSSSVNWFHRLMTCGTYAQFNLQVGCPEIPKTCSSSVSSTIQLSRALHSWVYPQGSLPPAVVSALTLSVAGGGNMDFLSKRQVAWEDSF